MRIKKEIMMVKKDLVEVEEETGFNSRRDKIRRKKLEGRGDLCKRGYAGESREDKRHNGKK